MVASPSEHIGSPVAVQPLTKEGVMDSRRKLFCALVALMFSLVIPDASAQTVIARVSLSDQEMMVYVDNTLEHVWKVSTARRDCKTSLDGYVPFRLDKNHCVRIRAENVRTLNALVQRYGKKETRIVILP